MTHSTIEGSDKPIRSIYKSKEYSTWATMIQRCHNPANTSYRFYGERGIEVCSRWRSSFLNFYADMGGRPGPEYSIDRIDNDGNYEPGNCRWTTRDVQDSNMRRKSALGVHRVWLPGRLPRYKAKLVVNGVIVLDEIFITFEEALVARMRAELEYL